MKDQEISDFYLSLNEDQKKIVRRISTIFLNADLKKKLIDKLFSPDNLENNSLTKKTLDFLEKHGLKTIKDIDAFGVSDMSILKGATPDIIKELSNLVKIYHENK